MKKNKVLGIITLSLATLCVGGTFAAYTITDNANSIGAKITLEPIVETFTKVYYQSSFFYGGEGTVYAYAWDSRDDSNKNAAWPGVAMTTEDYKHGLYSYEVSDKYDTIIFHANGGESDPTKTGDLTIDRTNVYYCQHQDAWDASLDDCTFSYYLTGVLTGVSGWGNKNYQYGLLKNYSGGNVNEYMCLDYIPNKNDEFKAIDANNTYYGLNGSPADGSSNFNVAMANSDNQSAIVYFTPNSNLWCGVDIHYLNEYNKWNPLKAYMWVEGGTNCGWPGRDMTRDNDQDYWYHINMPLYWDCVIFNNGNSGTGNQTGDLKGIDMSKPYYNQGWKSSK